MSVKDLNYGVIGNCRTAALVSFEGRIDWLCLPSFDSPSLFARLLDKDKGGHFGFLFDTGVKTSQCYLPGTNVLKTRFDTAEGSFEVIDFMPRYRSPDEGYYISPEIYRLIRPISGRPRVAIDYEPAMDYARAPARHRVIPPYIRSSSETNDEDNVYLYSSLDLLSIVSKSQIEIRQEEFLLLSYHQKLVRMDVERVKLELQRTRVYWMNWNNRSRKFEQYNDLLSRSLLVLKLLMVESTGAILAALTTSIPETIGESRNWDYRYTWLRDASMSIHVLSLMGHPNAAQRFLGYIKRIIPTKNDDIQIMYGIRGERELEEEILPHLAGYEDSRPVRIGNAAYTQRQNDSFGYLMDVIYHYFRHMSGTLDDLEEIWAVVRLIGRKVTREWHERDNSIWEFRNTRADFVFSKVMCWVALDRAAKIAEILGKSYYQELWGTEAEAIRTEVFERGWNADMESFTQAYGGEDLDASLLQMERYGFIDAMDERYVKTVDCVKAHLFKNGLMYRYTMSDDFGAPQSAFTICKFWLIRALYVTGREEEAREVFDELITYATPLGLFSEDLDFETKRPLGNFPQAYSHLALVDVVSLLAEPRFSSPFIRP